MRHLVMMAADGDYVISSISSSRASRLYMVGVERASALSKICKLAIA